MKKLHIKSVLVPVDFSEMSIQAIPTAKALAERFGAAVHLVNVHEYYYPTGALTPMPAIPVSSVVNPQEAQNAVAQHLHDLAKEHGLNGQCFAEIGVPAFNEICWVAQKVDADLIVTPTHGRWGLDHVLLGSTAERLVQHSPCPVFVARQNMSRKAAATSHPVMSLDTILVPVDFSLCSLAGLDYAIHFADRFAARIIVLHVVDLGLAVTADGYAMYDLSAIEEARRKEGEEQMAAFIRWAKFGRVKYLTVVKVGSAVPTICSFVEKEKIDLVITSTHGRTGLRHVLLGSVSERIVQRASCPVLAVPSHPQVRAGQLKKETPLGQKSNGASKRKAVKRPPSRQKAVIASGYPLPERRRTNKFREGHLKRS